MASAKTRIVLRGGREMNKKLDDIEMAIQIERFNTLHQVGEWLEERCQEPLPDNLLDDFRVKITGRDILSLKDGKLP